MTPTPELTRESSPGTQRMPEIAKPPFWDILNRTVSRRKFLAKGSAAVATAIVASQVDTITTIVEIGNKIAQAAELTPTRTSSPRPETPTSTPTPTAEVNKNNKELKIQTIQNPIEFTYKGQQYKWLFDNLRYGIPPNDENARTGTVDVEKNGVYVYSFQLKRSLYPKATDGRSAVIGGLLADTQTGAGYMITAVAVDGGYELSWEYIGDISNPTDYDTREAITEGLGVIIRTASQDSFYLTEDSQGKCLNQDVTGAIDSTKNGTYRARLAAKGNPIPPAEKQGAEPTPTLTPTITPTPTVTRVVTWVKKLFLPVVRKLVSLGGW